MAPKGLSAGPSLESKLQAARLDVLLPVLLELGVECSEDLEFIEERDIENRDDITPVHKRRFLEWKAKLLEESSTSASSRTTLPESPSQAAAHTLKAVDNQIGSEHAHQIPPHCGQASQASSSTDRPSVAGVPSLPMPSQTPRTRVLPLVQVLRELEEIDLSLQEERIRSASITEELQEERKRNKRLDDELQEARTHSKSIAEAPQEDGKLSTTLSMRMAQELQEEREHSKSLAEELERVRSASMTELQEIAKELQEERKFSSCIADDLERVRSMRTGEEQKGSSWIAEKIIAQELQDERKHSNKIAEELERARKVAEELQEELQVERMCSARMVEEWQEERKLKTITEEPEHVNNMSIADELQEERELSKIVAENHTRDMAMLEEMLEHVSAENALLKATLAAPHARSNAQGGPQGEGGQDIPDGKHNVLYEPG